MPRERPHDDESGRGGSPGELPSRLQGHGPTLDAEKRDALGREVTLHLRPAAHSLRLMRF